MFYVSIQIIIENSRSRALRSAPFNFFFVGRKALLYKGKKVSFFLIFDCIFQLNDVERGGATAFPRAGVAVRPTKGGAAFWYNLKRSGKPDPMTLHGACPVLLGHKWGKRTITYFVIIQRKCIIIISCILFKLIVSNKWIRETAQTFHRPCTLDANE